MTDKDELVALYRKILEREIASADGIDYVESVSAPNISVVRSQLRLNYDPNDALTQITSKVNRVRRELPAGAEQRPQRGADRAHARAEGRRGTAAAHTGTTAATNIGAATPVSGDGSDPAPSRRSAR